MSVALGSKPNMASLIALDDDDDDISPSEALCEQLFANARKAAKEEHEASQRKKQKRKQDDRLAFEEGDDIVSLGGPAQDGLKKRKRAVEAQLKDDKAPSSMSAGVATAASDHDTDLDRLGSSSSLADARHKSRRQVQKELKERKSATAGSKWFDMPAFPKSDTKSTGANSASSRYSGSANGATAEEMRREVQAIRLRNALDPKRFYKGGAGLGSKGMPEFAQLGRIISSPLEPASTMGRAERGKTVVDELVRDAEATAYAKRKFGEQQEVRQSGTRRTAKSKGRGSKRGKR